MAADLYPLGINIACQQVNTEMELEGRNKTTAIAILIVANKIMIVTSY